MVRSNALWMWVALAVAACAGLASPAAAIVQGRDEPALARHAVMVLGDRGSFCTGVVLSPTVVMTAGHCVAGASAWRIYFKDAAGTGVMLEPRTVTVHPGYDANAVKSRRPSIDLAMLRLAEPLPSALQPASLAEANGAGAGQKLSLAGQTLSVAGYGVSIERDPKTGGRFRAADLGVVEPYGPSRILVWLSDPALKTSAGKPGSGACSGDSGGPIFGADRSVVALTVWAEGAGKTGCGALTQGLLIAPQRSWIDGVMRAWEP
jgi:secreted trypsin-like serine protease